MLDFGSDRCCFCFGTFIVLLHRTAIYVPNDVSADLYIFSEFISLIGPFLAGVISSFEFVFAFWGGGGGCFKECLGGVGNWGFL